MSRRDSVLRTAQGAGPLAKKATALFTELLGWIGDQFRAIGRGDTSRKLATQLFSSLQGVSALAHGNGPSPEGTRRGGESHWGQCYGVQGDVSKLADLDRLYETVNAEGQRMASLGLNLPALLAMLRRGRCFRALQSASLGERCGHQDSQKRPYRPLPRQQLPKGRCVPRATAGSSRVSSPYAPPYLE